MKVFLTGASGYIGRHIALELLSRGHQITGLARKSSERTNYSPAVEWCYADLAHFDSFWNRLASSDAVVHCAMDYSSGSENSELDRAFVTRMNEFAGHFVYTGNLFSDRQDGLLDEAPQTTSEHWRYQTEATVLRAPNPTSVIRLGFVYGGRGSYFWEILSPGSLAQFKAEPVPEALWPMVHVTDVAGLYASVLELGETGVFHAYDGNQVEAGEVIDSVRSVYDSNGISSSTSHDYVQNLLQSSILTSNRRSLSIGWRPVYSSFVENAERAYAESKGKPSRKPILAGTALAATGRREHE